MLVKLKRVLRRVSGPLVLVVWQTAPVVPAQDASGRTRLTFGYGRGDFVARAYSPPTCDGGGGFVLDEFPSSFKVGGAQLEHWASPTARIVVSAASVRGSREVDEGASGTLLAAYEGSGFGIGGGFTMLPRISDPMSLTAYIRAGAIDYLHVAADLNAPGVVPQLTGSARLGLGVNRGRRSGLFSAFAGIAQCWYCDRDGGRSAAFGELSVPIGHRFDLLAFGLAGADDMRAFGAGIRANF